ncbi:MAG: hypothetical protein PHC51_11180 [bacterium]|nr:hypothetical protein [bacterium]
MKNTASSNPVLSHIESFVDNLAGQISLEELQGASLSSPEAALSTILAVQNRLKIQQNLARGLTQACLLKQTQQIPTTM